MGEEENANLLKRAWHERDRLYHELFGPHKYSLPKKYEPPTDVESAAVSTPSEIAALSGKTLSEKDISILAYEPNSLHPYWTFATSGLSNPWFGQNEDISGFACELVLKTTSPGRWAVRLLRRLIYYITSYSGTLSPGVSLQFDAPLIRDGSSPLGGIIVWYVDEAPDTIYKLSSGPFGIFSVMGITQDEGDFIETIDQYGCWFVQQMLRESGFEQNTEPKRESLLKREDFNARVNGLRNYLSNFGFTSVNDAEF